MTQMEKLQSRFEAAAAEAQQLGARPSNDTLLKLYALYKQATQGDVRGRRPGITNPVGRAKYDAWARVQGQSREDAMQAYIDLVDELKSAN